MFFFTIFTPVCYVNLKNEETFKLIFKSSGKKSLNRTFLVFSNWKFSIFPYLQIYIIFIFTYSLSLLKQHLQ